jgi:hypothetical protein
MPERVEEAQKILLRNPKNSLSINFHNRTVRKIYQSDLPACPYKIHLGHHLTPNAKEQRFQYTSAHLEPDIIGKI